MQLVSDRITVWDTMKDKVYDAKAVEEKLGVRPDQVRDYLALLGDSSDNIPGVPGVGAKTAGELLKEWGDLDQILEAAQSGRITGKRGEILKTHESSARISAELATVRKDLTVDISPEALKYEFSVNADCLKLLSELEFYTLVKKWSASEAKPKLQAIVPDDRFEVVNTESGFSALLKEMESVGVFGFDLETTSLNPREAEIVGLAICCRPEKAFYIPIGHRDSSVPQLAKVRVLEALRPFLESAKFKKVGQNLKYDWSILIQQGMRPAGLGFDTMVAAYVLDPGGRYNLQLLASKYLDYEVLSYEDVCGKGKEQLTFDQVNVETATRYSAEDAWLAIRLRDRLKPELEAEKLEKVFTDLDLPLIPVLTRMEMRGVAIDVPWFNQLSEAFKHELQQIETRIQAFTSKPINLNSPKQLGQLLFEELKLPTQSKTKTGFSTDATVLEALAPLHEVPRLLLEYREISKLKGTYVDPLPLLRDAKTNRIHAHFHQTVAATGRLSSSDPNLQNIPIRSERGMKIRRGFIPSEGNLLVSADYSQIELRLLAHMSRDPELTRAFQNQEDVHEQTAREIFKDSLGEGLFAKPIDDQQRAVAKAINFGLMYGKTAFGLSQELGISRKDAKDMIDRYFVKYRSVKVFLEAQIASAKENGYVQTLFGRKRYLPDISAKNPAIRNNAERMAMNTPIQGTAADLMKIAMLGIDRRLMQENLQSQLLIQVHDEVVLDCPPSELAVVKKILVEEMEGAMDLTVPLKVNVARGKNWMDLESD